MQQQKGFTLIELMVVLAVVGIVMAMGVPAYQNYLQNARIATVDTNYKNAIRVMRNEFYKRQVTASRGGTNDPVNLAAGDVINILDPSNSIKAGDGTSAGYATTASVNTGAIGIAITGAEGAYNLTITQPAYLNKMQGTSTDISSADL